MNQPKWHVVEMIPSGQLEDMLNTLEANQNVQQVMPYIIEGKLFYTVTTIEEEE